MRRRGLRRFDPELVVDDLAADDILRVERHDTADDVFQLADIARPWIGLEQLQRLVVKTLGVKPLAHRAADEMAHQVRHILGAIPERRQAQGHDVETIIEIFAKQALVDQDLEILVGGGNNADIGLDRGAATHRRVLALLQHAQQPGLGVHRHVADLVEEQGSTLGLLEASGGLVLGAGESTLFVTEQLGFDQVAGNRSHVDGHKGAVAALAVVMQRLGNKFLAGS